MCVYVHVYLSVCLSVYLSIYQSNLIYPILSYLILSYPSIYLSISLSHSPSPSRIYKYACIHLFVCVCLCIYMMSSAIKAHWLGQHSTPVLCLTLDPSSLNLPQAVPPGKVRHVQLHHA